MADITVNFFCSSLARFTTFRLYLPNDVGKYVDIKENPYYRRPTKTLFLLHGYANCDGRAGDGLGWGLFGLASEYNVALVMINGENGFYLDGESSVHQYETMLAEEVPPYLNRTFGLCKGAEDTFICGFSMGGYGALHTGLDHPEVFGKIGAVSSALILSEIEGMKPGESNAIGNYFYYRECFGDLDHLMDSDKNLEVLVRKKRDSGLPEMYICCGIQDDLIESNRKFHQYLSGLGIMHVYKESPGVHNMDYCSGALKDIFYWMYADKF